MKPKLSIFLMKISTVVLSLSRLLDIPGFDNQTYSVNDPASYKRISSYGSIPTRGSSFNPQSTSYPSPHVRGTTPPMLFSSAGSNPYKPVTQSEEME